MSLELLTEVVGRRPSPGWEESWRRKCALGRQSVAVGRFGIRGNRRCRWSEEVRDGAAVVAVGRFGIRGNRRCRWSEVGEEGELGGELGVGEGGDDDGFVDGRRSGEAAGSDGVGALGQGFGDPGGVVGGVEAGVHLEGFGGALSLDFKVSLFSLSFVIVRERAPESHSAGSVCHLRRRRPWCAVKRLLRFGARCALAMDSQDSC